MKSARLEQHSQNADNYVAMLVHRPLGTCCARGISNMVVNVVFTKYTFIQSKVGHVAYSTLYGGGSEEGMYGNRDELGSGRVWPVRFITLGGFLNPGWVASRGG